ncbi:hypothetical protein ACFFX0_32050 [Citricoccus parietis]|uniref:Uncharacterized protein n=1 Tax=Citricoccus parietis TaxID=592307 RepID=A0ABV5G9D3_9MICC
MAYSFIGAVRKTNRPEPARHATDRRPPPGPDKGLNFEDSVKIPAGHGLRSGRSSGRLGPR